MSRNVYNRAQIVDDAFVRFLEGWDGAAARRTPLDEAIRPGSALRAAEFLELFESQLISRHIDLVSRVLRAKELGFYTIGSAGHEGNAVLGRLTRSSDPAFLHYRSGALMIERARHLPGGADPLYDALLSQVASAEDPVSGGRHKVWGSAPLWVLPQTSTIASHLPKAVGTAIAIRSAIKIGQTPPVPRDSIVLCSFGDASVNHSSALAAFGAAGRAVYQQMPVPILFVCEDNGLGISVRTPPGWVADAFRARPGIKYFAADGLDLVEAYNVTRQAVAWCRTRARPVFLHLETVRLLGHAGSDVELEYRSLAEVEATEARDPLLRSARTLLEAGVLSAAEILERYEEIRRRAAAAAQRAAQRPRLSSAAEVVAPLAPFHPEQVDAEATRADYEARRLELFGGRARLPENQPPRHLAALINLALHDLLLKYPQALIFGEDVAQKGGVYHVTANLFRRFGPSRVFNTILDETTILGLAQGFAYMNLLPIPEIQYLAYFHNACDQIRGEACSTQFFSRDQFRNPMVLRIAGLAYQKGFGGHFHNDNSIAALRDIPGLILACPSRGDDAVGMLRTAAALARVDGRVVVFLEPIALYMTKDLLENKDGAWLFRYPPPDRAVPFGEGHVYHESAADLAIVSYGNGVPMALRAAHALRRSAGIEARVVDLRWLNPLNVEWLARHATECRRVLVVDEGRRTGGLGEALVTAVVEHAAGDVAIRRVTGEDTYIPLGPAADLVLPSVERIVEAAALLAPSRRR